MAASTKLFISNKWLDARYVRAYFVVGSKRRDASAFCCVAFLPGDHGDLYLTPFCCPFLSVDISHVFLPLQTSPAPCFYTDHATAPWYFAKIRLSGYNIVSSHQPLVTRKNYLLSMFLHGHCSAFSRLASQMKRAGQWNRRNGRQPPHNTVVA